jgi:hypothetical protein
MDLEECTIVASNKSRDYLELDQVHKNYRSGKIDEVEVFELEDTIVISGPDIATMKEVFFSLYQGEQYNLAFAALECGAVLDVEYEFEYHQG